MDEYSRAHCIRVAGIVKALIPEDENLKIAAIFHDSIEDGDMTFEKLESITNKDVRNLVFEVTKTGYNKFPNLKTRRGVILKFADRLDNLVNMKSKDEEWQKRYIKKSKFWKKKGG